MKIEFVEEKQTPNTVRYKSNDDSVPTIYIRKAEAAKLGKRIVVTLESK